MDITKYIELYELEEKHWWNVGRRAILTDVLESFDLPINAEILEIGSGTGGNLNMLGSFGNVEAIEMSNDARELTKKRFGDSFKIFEGSLPNDVPVTKKYDLICLLDVLEHIPEDLKTLETIHALLKETGRIVITVPAYQWLWGQQDIIHHHQRRYNRKTLLNIVPSGLYQVQKISHFNTFLFPLAVAARMKDRVLQNQQPTGAGLPSKFTNKLFLNIFKFERVFLKHCSFPFGLSIIMILSHN